jgi:hypothetical protein
VRISALRASRYLPPGRFLVLISLRGWVDPRDIVRLERLGQLKKSNDLIGNRIRDLNQLRYRVPLTVAQQMNKFPTSHGTRSFITVFTTARHWSPSYVHALISHFCNIHADIFPSRSRSSEMSFPFTYFIWNFIFISPMFLHTITIVVTIDGVWIGKFVLLTTCIHHSELCLTTVSLLSSTIHRLPQHPLSLFLGCCVFNSHSLATAFNSGDSSASRAHFITVWRISRNWNLNFIFPTVD